VVGDSPPVNARGVGESCKIVKQTDSGFGVDAQADPGGDPRSLICFAHRALLHDLLMGGNSPAGSWQPWMELWFAEVTAPSCDCIFELLSLEPGISSLSSFVFQLCEQLSHRCSLWPSSGKVS